MKQYRIDIKPITVNQCWQGRRFKTATYKKWRDDFGLIINNKEKEKSHELSVILEFYIKHESTTDLDNLIKPTLDALKENGIIEDDRFIKSLEAYKYQSEEEFIRVTIAKL